MKPCDDGAGADFSDLSDRPFQEISDEAALNWVRSIPKAELHLHLLGGMHAETAFELARKNAAPFPIHAESSWTAYYRTNSLAVFVERFIPLFSLPKCAEDFERIACEVFEDLYADGVRHAEPRITLTSHVSRGVEEKQIWEGLSAAVHYAHHELNLEVMWIVDFPRVLGLKTGELALELALRGKRHGVAGFDIAGFEGASCEDAGFLSLFHTGRENGLRLTAHAGETGPAEHVLTAIQQWGANRIGHGLRAIESPEAVQLLTERRIPLEICPTSNLALGLVEDIGSHPLEALRKLGVEITLNSDDPSLFGTTPSLEILTTARAFGWGCEEIQEIIQNGWRHCFA